MIYLAAPYSHPDPAVREDRFHAINRYAAKLMQEGQVVFSPISHSHPIAFWLPEGLGWDFWQRQDLPMLRRCQLVKVLALPGWEDSKGVLAEMKAADEWEIPVQVVYE